MFYKELWRSVLLLLQTMVTWCTELSRVRDTFYILLRYLFGFHDLSPSSNLDYIEMPSCSLYPWICYGSVMRANLEIVYY